MNRLPVRNIPKFKDRANWSRDTVQPKRRRACVYQTIGPYPVIKNIHNSGRSRTDFKISLQYSSRFHIISKESIWCNRMRVLNYSLQGTLGCSNWFRTDRRGRGFTDLVCKIFDWSKLVNLLRSYKTGMVLPINFYRTRIKEPVIITRIKSSSNLLIFLVCFFVCVVSCWLHASGAFFACCRTCNVLILSQIISVCSISSEIHHLQLKFVFFLWFFLKLWMNIWRIQQ